MRRGLLDVIAAAASLTEIIARSVELHAARAPPVRAAKPARVSKPFRASVSSSQPATSDAHGYGPYAVGDAGHVAAEELEKPAERPISRAEEPAVPPVEPVIVQEESEPVSVAPQAPAEPLPEIRLATPQPETPVEPVQRAPMQPQSITYSAVPSTRLGRLFHYGGLAADVGFGALSQAFRGSETTETGNPRYPLSEASVRRLVSRMSRMRGAALKIGQFASMQGAKILPPQIEEILVKVQHSAHFMPEWQVQDVLSAQLGSDWRDKFGKFDMRPMAAASIGQVHRATLHDGTQLAVKVQFPGVAKSVQSDIRNIALLLQAGALLPRGLFLENSLAVLGRELADECDYRREAAYGHAFRDLLEGDAAFAVPRVIDELSSEQVLITEYAIGRTLHNVDDLSQELRDEIGTKILRLCLREIFHFRLMQTDPNWSNFLWQSDRRQIELIDFGAGRRYTDEFVDRYLSLLQAAISGDRETCVRLSREIGYLTGEENEVRLLDYLSRYPGEGAQTMETAHYESMAALGEPFQDSAPRPYLFRDQTITDRVRAQVPIMLKHRLTPPPKETYSLNRKLSGAFLLCARLGSRVDCVGMLREVLDTMAEQRSEAQQRLLVYGNRLD